MPDLLSRSSIYFGQSNVAGKFIIIILAAFSLLAWTVMLGKWLDLKKLRTANARLSVRLAKSPY